MTVKEIMERTGMTETGKAIAYIRDALDNIALEAETHVEISRIDINKNQRYYEIPNDAVKITDIRCKHHNNNEGVYKSIPRSIYEPVTEDTDGI